MEHPGAEHFFEKLVLLRIRRYLIQLLLIDEPHVARAAAEIRIIGEKRNSLPVRTDLHFLNVFYTHTRNISTHHVRCDVGVFAKLCDEDLDADICRRIFNEDSFRTSRSLRDRKLRRKPE